MSDKDVQDRALDTIEQLALEIPGLLKEYIRAGISNPVMGIAGSIIISDILKRAGIISQYGQTAVLVAVGALEAGSIIDDIGALLPFHRNATSTEPSATSIVFADNNGQVKADIARRSK